MAHVLAFVYVKAVANLARPGTGAVVIALANPQPVRVLAAAAARGNETVEMPRMERGTRFEKPAKKCGQGFESVPVFGGDYRRYSEGLAHGAKAIDTLEHYAVVA